MRLANMVTRDELLDEDDYRDILEVQGGGGASSTSLRYRERGGTTISLWLKGGGLCPIECSLYTSQNVT